MSHTTNFEELRDFLTDERTLPERSEARLLKHLAGQL